MKTSEFIRWLKSRGVLVENGTRHFLLVYQGKRQTLPRHLSKEINEKIRKNIIRDLGL
ncbi:mRNA interferase [Burkholderiales bacterium YL45]|uniref:mRNA interferase n=1 Tax=Turicimonas muris TaxID=1796652 RepID=A0A227KQR9_9BURK|nr:mRNA interferase [Burkholderiales bacterium YL45]OXE50881.1 mRNA interferase [Turicimonas muris]